jgi:hypothetical protein
LILRPFASLRTSSTPSLLSALCPIIPFTPRRSAVLGLTVVAGTLKI